MTNNERNTRIANALDKIGLGEYAWENAVRCVKGHVAPFPMQGGSKKCGAFAEGSTDILCGSPVKPIPHDFTDPYWLIPAVEAWCDTQGWNYSSHYLGHDMRHWQLIPNPKTMRKVGFTWPNAQEGKGYEALTLMFAEALNAEKGESS